jgi:photosystem II stability/assembly factor-like uncharacterized protein
MKFVILYFVTSLVFGTPLLNGQWTSLELPAGRGGAVYSIAVKGTKLFAGKSDGVYVSEDNGLHWKKINPPLAPRDINLNSRSIAATDRYIIVAGSNMDLHISTDDGETWIKQGLERGFYTARKSSQLMVIGSFAEARQATFLMVNPQMEGRTGANSN